VAAVYASPLERARETAAPVAKAFGLRVRSERGLLECDFGSWTGRELKELARLPEWGQVQRNPSMFRFPEGESFLEMQARASDAVRRILATHPGEIVVCVSHADPIKALAADAMGSHLDHFQRFVVSPCSITVIAYSAAGPTVLCLNSTDKLPGVPVSEANEPVRGERRRSGLRSGGGEPLGEPAERRGKAGGQRVPRQGGKH